MDDVAPDGSPVAFYRRLPAMGEPEVVHAAIGPGPPDSTSAAAPAGSPATAVRREQRLGDARTELVRATVEGDRLEAEVRYGVDGRTWRQAFRARLLDEAALRVLLARHGLAFGRWLERPGGFVARRTDDEPARGSGAAGPRARRPRHMEGG